MNAENYPPNMTDPRAVSQEEASRAKDLLMAKMTFEQIFGPPGLINGRHLRKSVGVTADPPEYADYYIKIIAPVSIDVSHVPASYDGVRIVVVHEDLPGFRLLGTQSPRGRQQRP